MPWILLAALASVSAAGAAERASVRGCLEFYSLYGKIEADAQAPFGKEVAGKLAKTKAALKEAIARSRKKYSHFNKVDDIVSGMNGSQLPEALRQRAAQAKAALAENPEMALLADETNRILQDATAISDYYEELWLDVARDVSTNGTRQEIDTGRDWSRHSAMRLPFSEKRALAALKRRASAFGWNEIVEFPDVLPDDEFFSQGLGAGKLFRDPGRKFDHSSDGHLFQMLLVAEKLESKFGPGAARKFFSFLASPEGQPLWYFLFDRGPAHDRDLRGPTPFLEWSLGPGVGLH